MLRVHWFCAQEFLLSALRIQWLNPGQLRVKARLKVILVPWPFLFYSVFLFFFLLFLLLPLSGPLDLFLCSFSFSLGSTLLWVLAPFTFPKSLVSASKRVAHPPEHFLSLLGVGNGRGLPCEVLLMQLLAELWGL